VTTVFSLYRWFVGLLYVGFVCSTVIVLSLFLPTRAYDPVFKAMLRGLFAVLFIPVRVKGGEALRTDRPRLYMANHVSLFDAPLLGAFLPGAVRGVEGERHFRWPLYGTFVRRIGNIPIDRDNAFSSMRSLRRARQRLARGHSLTIMPEAHRTLDGQLRQFKRLPFSLAKAAGVDVVPVGLSGLYALNNKHSWRIRRSRLLLSIGTVVPAEEAAARSVDELRRIIRDRIAGLIERP
jgi:1-acyl-sn-glycerol-3-phosphate acyltransferase